MYKKISKSKKRITLITSCASTPPTMAQTGLSSEKRRERSSSETLSTGTLSFAYVFTINQSNCQ